MLTVNTLSLSGCQLLLCISLEHFSIVLHTDIKVSYFIRIEYKRQGDRAQMNAGVQYAHVKCRRAHIKAIVSRSQTKRALIISNR